MIGPILEDAQTDILRFTIEILVIWYFSLVAISYLVTIIIKINAKEFIIPEFVIICFHGDRWINTMHHIANTFL